MSKSTLTRSTHARNPLKMSKDYISSISKWFIMMGNLVYIMNKYKWKIVMKEEMDALDKNKTWGLVELPNNRKIVGCKWVYKLKRGIDDKFNGTKHDMWKNGILKQKVILIFMKYFHQLLSLFLFM